jgi:pseudouridine-5'-phosphate glycosidase
LAGLQVFSTGGIGGVHLGAADTFDISADLTALGRLPLICVCAGAKAILDLPKTVEYIETIGLPIVGFQTDGFPAFYSRTSGLPVDIVVNSADEAADVAKLHWGTGISSAVLVCVPIPKDWEIPAVEVAQKTAEAIDLASRAGVRGKALTPFLLAQLERLSNGRTLVANRSLLINNARIAARIASSLSRRV